MEFARFCRVVAVACQLRIYVVWFMGTVAAFPFIRERHLHIFRIRYVRHQYAKNRVGKAGALAAKTAASRNNIVASVFLLYA